MAGPKKQPAPSAVPGAANGEAPAAPSPQAEYDPLNITDAQGIAHRGSVVLRGSWTPELGCLDEGAGEEFRIVLLREPLAQGTPTPECGVAVCAPDAAARPLARVREAGVAYRARRTESILV